MIPRNMIPADAECDYCGHEIGDHPGGGECHRMYDDEDDDGNPMETRCDCGYFKYEGPWATSSPTTPSTPDEFIDITPDGRVA